MNILIVNILFSSHQSNTQFYTYVNHSKDQCKNKREEKHVTEENLTFQFS
jgi:hypothetical protein